MKDPGTRKDRPLLATAIVLMLAGAAMLVAGVSGVIPFPLIAIGVTTTALAQRRARGRHESAGHT